MNNAALALVGAGEKEGEAAEAAIEAKDEDYKPAGEEQLAAAEEEQVKRPPPHRRPTQCRMQALGQASGVHVSAASNGTMH